MTIEITEKKEEEPKKVEPEDIKNTLKAADDYQKLKEENDRLEKEYQRQLELKARIAIGGKADAGTLDKSQEDKDKEEAAELLKPMGID